MDLEKLARQYFDEVRKNEFSRLRAWEFIYAYTRVDDLSVLVDESHIEKTGLHLGLYLAQWGMFRGSGKLIDQNLNYFMWMSKFFFKELPENFPDFYGHTFSDFAHDNFCKEFDEVMKFIRSEELMMNPSDTLISKILLGIWGHVPAFDSQFIISAKKVFKHQPIKCNSDFLYTFRLYLEKTNNFNSTEYPFEIDGMRYSYTFAKLADMAFWLGAVHMDSVSDFYPKGNGSPE